MSKMLACQIQMTDRDGNAIDAKESTSKHVSGRFELVIVGKNLGKMKFHDLKQITHESRIP